MLKAIPCSIMRGGTSKGLYFLASDLPSDPTVRDQVLLAAMGSPDTRQIDGLGGAHPLTSKVAVISPSSAEDADVDYLFLQVGIDKAQVSDAQNCGNILAGVGPYAIEQGLVDAREGVTPVRIRMLNTGAMTCSHISTPQQRVCYSGDASIDGVPGTAAAIPIEFLDVAGASCGSLFPTGNPSDEMQGLNVTCIDNGMPVVLVDARVLGLNGNEPPAELEANDELRARIESLRLEAGKKMHLGDVSNKTVPKISIISAPQQGGLINTRTFIPHRVHEAIGVLGSVSVATACMLRDTVAYPYWAQQNNHQPADSSVQIEVEHPSGQFCVEMDVQGSDSIEHFSVHRAALLRTARLLMRGELFVPETAFTTAEPHPVAVDPVNPLRGKQHDH